MRPRTYILIPLLLALTGCGLWGPKPPPQPATRTEAKEEPSARQPLHDARRYSSEADLKAAEARARLGDAKSGIEEYRGRVLSLSELVRKLQLQGNAAATDLKKLYDELSQQDAYIEQLIGQLDAVQESMDQERSLRVKADEKLEETQVRLVAKEKEAEQLRQQLRDAETDVRKAQQNAQDNFETAAKARGEADRIAGQRDLIVKLLIGVSVLLLISLVVNYIQFRTGKLLPI